MLIYMTAKRHWHEFPCPFVMWQKATPTNSWCHRFTVAYSLFMSSSWTSLSLTRWKEIRLKTEYKVYMTWKWTIGRGGWRKILLQRLVIHFLITEGESLYCTGWRNRDHPFCVAHWFLNSSSQIVFKKTIIPGQAYSIWATTRQNMSSGVSDQACAATEAS